MKRSRKIVSFILVLFIFFSDIPIQLLNPGVGIQAYAEGWLTINLSVGQSAETNTTTVTAAVYDNGLPVAGKQVHFSTTLGSLDSAVKTTDELGQVSVALRSDIPGTASVTATTESGGNTDGYAQTNIMLTTTEVNTALLDDYNWLNNDETILTWGDGYTYLYALEATRLRFPKLGEIGGSAISWASSDTSVIAVEEDPNNVNNFIGVVTRPTYAQGNKDVTVTATISKGSAVLQKTYNITVLAKATDTEKVTLDKEWLTEQLVLGENEFNDVRSDLYLPVKGPNGSNIGWTTSDPAALSLVYVPADYGSDNSHYLGTVMRPDDSDKPVTLAAIIDYNGVEEQKTFDMVVTKKENIYLAQEFRDFSNAADSLLCNGDVSIAAASYNNSPEIQALRFISNQNGGSVFTRNKIRLRMTCPSVLLSLSVLMLLVYSGPAVLLSHFRRRTIQNTVQAQHH